MLKMSETARRPGLPSRGTREALDRAAGNTRSMIEETAISMFHERGSQVTSVRDITKACGMTPGALYKHFDSKEDMLFEVIRSGHEHFLGRLDEALGLTGGSVPPVKLAALVRALVLFHTDHRREARVANQEYRFLPKPQQALILELRRQIRSRFRDVLADGASGGTFALPTSGDADPAQLAAVTICDMGMRVSEWYDDTRRPSPQELAELHVAYALRMVGAIDR